MAFWLVKSDPVAYSWDDMKKDKSTPWDGVRNYQARNNLRDMRKGDKVLFYHSQTTKEIMGETVVTKQAFQDPTTDDDRWVAVQLSKPVDFKHPVSLAQIKATTVLENIALVKQSRLSVMPLTPKEYKTIVSMGKTGK